MGYFDSPNRFSFERWRDDDFSCYDPPLCCHCEESQKNLRNCREFFSEVLKSLYSKDDPIPETFESWLDEIAHYLDVPIHDGTLQIERKNNTLKEIQNYLSKVS